MCASGTCQSPNSYKGHFLCRNVALQILLLTFVHILYLKKLSSHISTRQGPAQRHFLHSQMHLLCSTSRHRSTLFRALGSLRSFVAVSAFFTALSIFLLQHLMTCQSNRSFPPHLEITPLSKRSNPPSVSSTVLPSSRLARNDSRLAAADGPSHLEKSLQLTCLTTIVIFVFSELQLFFFPARLTAVRNKTKHLPQPSFIFK